MRMIDAVQALNNINRHHRPTPVSQFESGFNQGLNQAMWEITHAPTLTPPNEPLTQADLDSVELNGESARSLSLALEASQLRKELERVKRERDAAVALVHEWEQYGRYLSPMGFTVPPNWRED